MGEAPLTTGPDDGTAARRDHFRAADADREHVAELLKTAFAQGRLTADELDLRVGQAFAARTYAELAALTADIPAGPAAAAAAAAGAPGKPARIGVRRPTKAVVSGAWTACAGIAMLASATSMGPLFLFSALVFVVSFVAWAVILATRPEKRPDGRLPRGPGQRGRAVEGGRRGGTGQDPALPGLRTDPTRTDLRAHRPNRSGRGNPARPGTGPSPAAAPC